MPAVPLLLWANGWAAPDTLFVDDKYDAAVIGAAFGCRIVGHRHGEAESLGRKPSGIDSGRDEIGLHRIRPLLRQSEIGHGTPDIVGVALDLDVDSRIGLEI